MDRRYKVVDAFSAKSLMGNPVAVVLDATDLVTDQMQAIARWTNLSETTFVLPAEAAGADYRLRIFTPDRELPFAGHPTLGSAHAVIEAGIAVPKDGQLVQESAVGLVQITVSETDEETLLILKMPEATQRLLTEKEVSELVAILGVPVAANPAPALVDVGAVWVVAEVEGGDFLLGIKPNFARSAAFERTLGATGLSIYGRNGSDIETRSFAPSCGVNEDPICGSGNGSIASFRLKGEQITPGDSYLARQGRMTGRDGLVRVRIAPNGEVFIGGACVTTVNGSINV